MTDSSEVALKLIEIGLRVLCDEGLVRPAAARNLRPDHDRTWENAFAEAIETLALDMEKQGISSKGLDELEELVKSYHRQGGSG